jgi:hypothetical protein
MTARFAERAVELKNARAAQMFAVRNGSLVDFVESIEPADGAERSVIGRAAEEQGIKDAASCRPVAERELRFADARLRFARQIATSPGQGTQSRDRVLILFAPQVAVGKAGNRGFAPQILRVFGDEARKDLLLFGRAAGGARQLRLMPERIGGEDRAACRDPLEEAFGFSGFATARKDAGVLSTVAKSSRANAALRRVWSCGLVCAKIDRESETSRIETASSKRNFMR